jgi:hypothetical protein
MSISSSISRFNAYLVRNGVRATARRIGIDVKRTLFSGRMVLFYCDLSALGSPTAMPGSLKVERLRSHAELSPTDLQGMASFWNPKQADRNIKERFELGASLWLIRCEEKLAGYGWTLQGRTVEPHYFPLGADDVQFLDFHVFPKFRGRAMDWFLMTCILHRLASEGSARAFGEAAEWNKASLSSFDMTPFRRLGWGRKFTVLGHTIVWWARDQAWEQKRPFQKGTLAATANKRPSIPDLRA